MEKTVIFRDNQELQSGDFINQQGWAQAALDHIVLDTIENGKAYSGFAVSKAQQTTLQVAPGRLYNAGAVYAREDAVTLDLYNDLPVVTKRQYAIVVWGQTVSTDIQPRNFIIDADTGLSQPQSVAMESDRYCNVEFVRGVESADPQIPTTDANVLVVAYVTCDTTGVISVVQNTMTQVESLADVGGRLAVMESAWQNMNGTIQTLRTDLANLAKQFLLYTPLTEFNHLVDEFIELQKKVNRPAAYLWFGTDYFVDESQSAPETTVDGAYKAYIHEGLRFPPDAAGGTTTLALLNSQDPYALVTSGFLIPKPSGSRVRLDCSFPNHEWIEDRILQYVFHNFHVRQLKESRWRHCVGKRYLPCPTSLVWTRQALFDSTRHIFSFANENWEDLFWRDIDKHNVDQDDPDWPRVGCDRDDHYWRDWIHIPYWSREIEEHDHSGQHICQTFLNAQDGWLTSVTVYLMKPYWESLDLVLSGCNAQGEPDHTYQTLARVSVDGDTLHTCSEAPMYAGDIETIETVVIGSTNPPDSNAWVPTYDYIHRNIPVYVYPVRIPIPPTFLRAGQRYGLHLASTYDHSFACSNRFEAYQVHQGHFWHSHDTVASLMLWNQNTPKHLRFKLHYATWGRWPSNNSIGGGLRYEINLQYWQLNGGINSVEVLTKAIIPEATDVNYQVMINSQWRSFAGGTQSPDFSSNPATLPARVVMTGTTDLMPGISLTPSQVVLNGPESLNFHHISELFEFGGTATSLKVVARVKGFDEDHHDLACSLHYASTHNTSGTSSDETLADGTMERTWIFTGLSITEVQIELDGTTDGQVDNFVVAQAVRYATAA